MKIFLNGKGGEQFPAVRDENDSGPGGGGSAAGSQLEAVDHNAPSVCR
jgi:hypothetical protein